MKEKVRLTTKKDSRKNFFRLLLFFAALIIPWILVSIFITKTSVKQENTEIKLINYKPDTIADVDHSKFPLLRQNFESPEQVTAACLTCHNLTASEIMHTSHWKWTKVYVTEQGDTIALGKKNIINNFCVGVPSNEPRCTSCHIGYGYKDKHFDFQDSSRIDCLICHDQTGTYEKFPTGAGYPVSTPKSFNGKEYLPPDYSFIARNVGTPRIENCGACHFVGGGGNNVKHGDIANELKEVTQEVDVHMAIDGAHMECVECHITERHEIMGNLYSIASENTNRLRCAHCHTEQPHQDNTLNRHVRKVSCQTCHIPTYAKESHTKMYWDWSRAGQFKEDGSLLVRKDSSGNIVYHSKKGAFVWENNVKPDYIWFNGKAEHYLLGEKVDSIRPMPLNQLYGNYHDKESRIIPVKKHIANQPYDPINRTIILPHLFGKDSMAYWKNFDWDKAARHGMQYVDLPYSGTYDFIETVMYWPINHMVAPADQSLQCADCHARDSRLKSLTGFYLPGRDHNNLLDLLGYALLIASFAGVLIHALLRLKNNNKSVKNN
ncbi:MAG: tetrathionate reductase family octaheme c-type cytochrome [Bacteroidales bacterium]|nr:tetrathionate reductase family octaheme c-type cytochrome [Bacteroidales bacterium]MCF8399602.1 tetrathionate reductase family octaheme c-type cytochrome [Bacteroidales bacterium]